MSAVRLRLHHRIVIPFVLVALVATAAAAFVALSVVSRALESRVQTQILSASVVLRGDFALNPSILRIVKDITGADVVTYTTSGAILASTIDPKQRVDLVSAVTASDATRLALADADGAPVVRQMDCGAPCYVAYRRVAASPDTVVALVAETSDLALAVRAVTRTILLAAAMGLVVMVVVSQVVARRVTAPLERLVEFTRDVSPESSRRRAQVGDDEIGRLAASFNEMLDRLEQSRDALVRSEKLALAGLMAARVAHDIRNPLSSIKMQTQLLRARLQGEEEPQALLAAVLHDIDQVESVIRDLLELARPSELRLQPTQLNDVILDVLRQLGPQLTHRKIGVETSLDPALPLIPLDGGRFRQAMLNVVVNAADAMLSGGTLQVVTRRVEGASTVVLDVCDDGIGVAPAILDRVFDPFVSTKHDGIGLGLVNARAVVESHGGRIELAPRQPRGTRASIWLPLGAVAARSGGAGPHEGVHG